MTDVELEGVLDLIATEVLTGDPNDEASRRRVVTMAASTRAELAAEEDVELRAEYLAAWAPLESLLPAAAETPEAFFEAVGSAVDGIQRAREARRSDGRAAAPAGDANPAAAAATGPLEPGHAEPLVLPEWSDEATLREFLANQVSVLDDIEADVLAMERGEVEGRADLLRRLHTMKGEAGVLGLYGLQDVCHALESHIAATEAPLDRTVDRLLVVRDWIATANAAYETLHLPTRRASEVVAQLETWTADPDAPLDADEEASSTPVPAAPEAVPTSEAGREATAAPTDERTPDTAPTFQDPETIALIGEFLDEASDGLGQADGILIDVEQSGAQTDAVGGLFRVFHTIKGVAGFLELAEVAQLAHRTETMLNKARDGALELAGTPLDLVFDATAMMRRLLGNVRDAIESSSALAPEPSMAPLLDALAAATEGKAVARPRSPAAPSATATNASAAPASESASDRTPTVPATSRIRETVKVDLEGVDNLVGMIGELVIVESMVANAPEMRGLKSTRMRNYMSQLTKITRDLQSVGLRMRMVPVRGLFQKMARMVRDLARKSDKDIRLVAGGESTEMDRSMVEQLADPLVHMIRNAVDHGIEPPDERVRAGKPAAGTIRLSAHHEGGSIVVEIADDGRGLARDRILEKARAKGLVREGDKLSDSDVYALIFHAGFSTAKQVTEISGRGVGMDVVRRNIESMRGRVAITSTPGGGTTFRIILPLTLAIIDGMLVACGEEHYIIPTLSIVKSIQPSRSMLHTFRGRGELLTIRDDTIPLLRLDRLLGIPGAVQDPTQALVVIVESFGRRLGVLVDDVVTQQQVVIKKLDAGIDQRRFLSGAAILSDGRVGLILNVDELPALGEEPAPTFPTTLPPPTIAAPSRFAAC